MVYSDTWVVHRPCECIPSYTTASYLPKTALQLIYQSAKKVKDTQWTSVPLNKSNIINWFITSRFKSISNNILLMTIGKQNKPM